MLTGNDDTQDKQTDPEKAHKTLSPEDIPSENQNKSENLGFETSKEVMKEKEISEGYCIEDEKEGITYIVKRKIVLNHIFFPYGIYEVNRIIKDEQAESRDNDSKEEISWAWIALDEHSKETLKLEANLYRKFSSTSLYPKVLAEIETDNVYAVITEKLPEKSLRELIENKDLDFQKLLLILSQIAYAISFLHQAGFVYRTLRPEVVLVGKPSKIIDLRWVSPLNQPVKTIVDFSGWCAPETLSKSEPLDERTDVYSIGAILYYFITGKTFEGDLSVLKDLDIKYPGVPQILYRTVALDKHDRYYNMTVLKEKLINLRKKYLPKTHYEVFARTSIGLEPSRTTNQDAYGFVQGEFTCENDSRAWIFACVADGMGGMEAGEKASEAAVNSLLHQISRAELNFTSPEEQNSFLKKLIIKANEEVKEKMSEMRVNGGSTIVSALLVDKILTVAYVGDSRAYLIRNNEISFLTIDQSLSVALALQEHQEIDPRKLRHDENRNVLVVSLGSRENLDEILIGDLKKTCQKSYLELQPEDVIILCSDGVWEPVLEEEIFQIVKRHGDNLSETTREIIDLAMRRGGHDNATVLIIKVKPYSETFVLCNL